MLENALGSFDEQLIQTSLAPEGEDGAKNDLAAPMAAAAPGHAPGPVRREQKKLRFSQNPTFIVRSMGLPLLGTLVGSHPRCLPPASLNPRPGVEIFRYSC